MKCDSEVWYIRLNCFPLLSAEKYARALMFVLNFTLALPCYDIEVIPVTKTIRGRVPCKIPITINFCLVRHWLEGGVESICVALREVESAVVLVILLCWLC